MSVTKLPVANDQIDRTMLRIIEDLSQAAVKTAAESVEKVLTISSNFLSQEAHAALKSFYDLYFAGATEGPNHNQDVDRIIAEAEALAEGGASQEVMMASIADGGANEEERLSRAALQKRLEGVIALEENFREQLRPILGSMQFEDATRQRLEHLVFAWQATIDELHQGRGEPDLEGVARAIAQKLSSDEERKIFYAEVLREEAPAGVEERSIWIDFAA